MMYKFKLILLGDTGVGKTKLLIRFVRKSFTECTVATISDFISKKFQVCGIDALVTIFDTAGQERYKSISQSYFRNADGVLLVYDVMNITSFHKMCNWFNELRAINEKAEVLIVGNKTDLRDKEHVSISFAKNFCETENLEFMEASAKLGENVDAIFHRVVEKVLYAKEILKQDESKSNGESSCIECFVDESFKSVEKVLYAEEILKQDESKSNGESSCTQHSSDESFKSADSAPEKNAVYDDVISLHITPSLPQKKKKKCC